MNNQNLVPAASGQLVSTAETGQIVAVRPQHVTDDKDLQIRQDVERVASAILANPGDATVTIEVYKIGADVMKNNTAQVGLMEARIADVMREVQTGNPVVKTLTEIKTQLDLVNPAVVSQTETTMTKKALFGLITWTAKYVPKGEQVLVEINKRKDTVASTVDGLKRHLWTGRDQALQNAAQLGGISNNLFETQAQLQEAAYTGQLLWQRLSEALQAETDPFRRKALQNLVNDLAVQVVDIQTVDTLNVQTRMAAETLINNARKIQQGVRRVTDVLLPAVATNLAVKAAALQQLEVVDAMTSITRASEQTILDTAASTREAVIRMEQMQSSALIDPGKLQQACDEYVKMMQDLERMQAETEAKARETSKALGTLANTMRDHADPLTKARQAREALELQ